MQQLTRQTGGDEDHYLMSHVVRHRILAVADMKHETNQLISIKPIKVR